MKKFLAVLLLAPLLALGQTNAYNILDKTGYQANSVAITGGSITGATINATTQGRLDNSTLVATDAFANQQLASSSATVPFAVTGGTYNQATLGGGGQVVILASGGVISSVVTVINPGTGYAVGDLLALPGGNSDAVIRVASVSGSGLSTLSVIYGGTGYTTGAQITTMPVPPGKRTINLTGVLTGNVTFIIQNGSLLTASREVLFQNNTTGASTITVFLSNGAGGTSGTGVVLPQGTNNSTSMWLQTDGVTDVWPATAALRTLTMTGALTPSYPAGIVGNATGNPVTAGSIGEFQSNTTTGTAITSGTTVNATSITNLPAGDWNCWGQALFLPTTGAIVADIVAGIGTVSATLPANPNASYLGVTLATGATGTTTLNPMVTRILISTPTTIFLTAEASSVTVAVASVNGYLQCQRR